MSDVDKTTYYGIPGERHSAQIERKGDCFPEDEASVQRSECERRG